MIKSKLLLGCSILMMIFMGSIYSWSVFRPSVETYFKVNTTVSGLPYMISLIFYALSMMITGRFINKKHLKPIGFIGATLIGLGWLLAGTSNTVFIFSIYYGLLIGTGVGMLYGIPVYLIPYYFPNKNGLVTGIVLAGFGMSPLLSAPIITILINNFGFLESLSYIGWAILIVLLISVFGLDTSLLPDNKHIDKSPIENKKLFTFIYLQFVVGTMIGLMVIGLTYQVGTEYYQFSTTQTTFLLGLFAICNGLARPLFGFLMDKYGYVFSSQLAMLLLISGGIIAYINQGASPLLFFISYSIFWLNLGAQLAMTPAAVKTYFGINSFAKNYGLMFSGYGVGALLGVILSGRIMDVFMLTEYLYVFIVSIVITMYLFLLINRKVYVLN